MANFNLGAKKSLGHRSPLGIQRVLSIMPNRPVRDQWEFLSKMERHFPIKPGQPIGMALATVCFSSEFPN